MVQKDNLDEVKKFAIDLLNLDVHPGDSETFVDHPIFKKRVEILLPNGPTDFTNMKPVDILNDAEGLEKVRAKEKN